MTTRFPNQLFQAADSNGIPLNGAKLNFYRTGTTTEKDTYSDSDKTTPNLNPVVSDGAGRFADIFMDTDEAYALVYTDASDNVIGSFDPYFPILPPGEFPIIAVSSKSSNYTVLESDRGADILVDASSGPVTITLLPVATAASGFVLTVVKTDSSVNVVTVDGNLAETINGATTVGLGEQYDGIEIGTEGTFWYIKSEKRLPTPAVGNADEIVTVNSAGTGFTTTTSPLPPTHLNVLTLSNGTDTTNDIDIAAGKARDTADTANLILAAAAGKQLDVSWSAGGTPGAPTGGLSSSLTLTNDTTYHAFLGLVSGTAEVGFDTSVTGANLVTDHSFTNVRLIGSVLYGTATLLGFEQRGDDFWLVDRLLDVNDGTPGTSAVLAALTVPTGRELIWLGHAELENSTNANVIITSVFETDAAASATFRDLAVGGGVVIQDINLDRATDTSSQVRYRSDNGTVTGVRLYTRGWRDRRGR